MKWCKRSQNLFSEIGDCTAPAQSGGDRKKKLEMDDTLVFSYFNPSCFISASAIEFILFPDES